MNLTQNNFLTFLFTFLNPVAWVILIILAIHGLIFKFPKYVKTCIDNLHVGYSKVPKLEEKEVKNYRHWAKTIQKNYWHSWTASYVLKRLDKFFPKSC